METGMARVTTRPTSINPWGIVSFRGTRCRCYFEPTRWAAGLYEIANNQWVYVQHQAVGLVAIGRLSQ